MSSSQTKSNVGRVICVNDKLRTDFASYLQGHKVKDRTQPRFIQKSETALQQTHLRSVFLVIQKVVLVMLHHIANEEHLLRT